MKKKSYNPEHRAWKGLSYKKGRKPVKELKEREKKRFDSEELATT